MVKVLTSVTSVLALVFMLGLTGCSSDVMGPDLDPAANEVSIETQDASAITADSDNGGGSTQRGQSHNEVDGMD